MKKTKKILRGTDDSKANKKLALKIENLCYSYPGISEPALDTNRS